MDHPVPRRGRDPCSVKKYQPLGHQGRQTNPHGLCIARTRSVMLRIRLCSKEHGQVGKPFGFYGMFGQAQPPCLDYLV